MKRMIWGLLVCTSLCFAVSSSAQTVETFVAPGSGITDGLVLDSQGNLFGCDFEGTTIFKVTPEGTVSQFATGFNHPNGLAIDDQDNIYLASTWDHAIYQISPEGTVEQYGSTIQNPNGVHFMPNSDTLIVTSYALSTVSKLAPDGTVIPWLEGGGLNGPLGLAVDSFERVYVANFNDGKVFRINADTLEYIATVPSGSLWGSEYACGFITYSDGYVYATGIAVNRIYRISLDGDLEVAAGSGISGSQDGDALTARFSQPNGIVATSSEEVLYISDFTTQAIRMLDYTTDLRWEPVELPAKTVLHANYPNPFNPSTEIRFTLQHGGWTTLRVFDVQGRVVSELVSENVNAGEHKIVFNADKLASGVYFYQLRSGNLVKTKQMVLCR